MNGAGRGRKRGSQSQTQTQTQSGSQYLLSQSVVDGEDGEGGEEQAQENNTKRKRGQKVDDQFRVSSKAVEQQGSVFEGQTYCVLESEFSYTAGGAGATRKFTRDDVSTCMSWNFI